MKKNQSALEQMLTEIGTSTGAVKCPLKNFSIVYFKIKSHYFSKLNRKKLTLFCLQFLFTQIMYFNVNFIKYEGNSKNKLPCATMANVLIEDNAGIKKCLLYFFCTITNDIDVFVIKLTEV